MRPVRVVLRAAGVSAPIPLDVNQSPFSVGLGATISGTATYTVQYTFDDVFASGFDPSAAAWISHTGLTDKTTSADNSLTYPVTAVRLNVASVSGSVTLNVIQAGMPGR
jgi:hypothetical protein